ncbi:conserved protein of unknown function [Acidithiobacillus ferrivorans]|uniref:Uncharacterized protein n=1 Tax=Acidithiobacillus ferrivorans TaxID=160808 RepID=A0A060ULR6_9PROT|nr:hypothetical protein [Acidithiobacillus ferrivorans]CDQ09291.1 conserved hypothetical protein [Acidithiobacillus ferrivorans]SMH64962.1 conserved protein of unknown function [Acidithiobacillus ferrivorans]
MKAARTADKMIAILQQAAANGESHGVIGHGKNLCGRIVLHITLLAKDHPQRLASIPKRRSRWLCLRPS